MTSMLVFDPTALSAAVTALQNAAGEIGSKLAVLESQSQTLSAYDSAGGTLLLAIGAAVCVVAYRVMLRIGRLPEEQRVLR